jgi:hypothetical protein
MIPKNFEHSNKVLYPASGARYSDRVERVCQLPCWTDGEQVVSLWRPSWRERLSILLFGRVWLAVLSGSTQPPAALTGARVYLQTREN